MAGSDSVLEYASRNFGIDYLYPYQRLVVANVLDVTEGSGDRTGPERQVVILPTGAGKSLCFQLPAALCPGPTVVVYPLLGLMADQFRRLRSTDLGAIVLRGGMTAGERQAAFDAIRSGAARIVLVNPEMLAVRQVLEFLRGAGVFHFVVDEAHCIPEWGDGFRPAYLLLGEAIKSIGPRVVTAFTATASPPILARIAAVLFGSEPYRLIADSPDRPNIRYEVLPALSMRRALRLAVRTMERPLIVFAPSRPGVELLAEDLNAAANGPQVRFYHAGLDTEERAGIEDWFMASGDGVLCSTCAYGMGMDKKNIRTVIHYGAPGSVEAYLQESGRAGRDGKLATALLIRQAAAADYGHVDCHVDCHGAGHIAGGTESTAIAKTRAAAMLEYATGTYGCRRSFLLGALGAKDSESTACTGCDRCDGTANQRAPGSDAVILMTRRHARRFSKREAATFLTGCRGTIEAPLRGALASWRVDEVEDALDCALATGMAMTRPAWPWKGKLAPGTDFSRAGHHRQDHPPIPLLREARLNPCRPSS
ncbi:MAG: ATP-dependent DNA helicase RecQ [Spirochaetae bacterium HGW-Spirochaetae-7]|nr:MAG: ATP-dependent DNA helicase RecQ [Spirochaetae bacterium HGW-Spirochaetae-7]